MVFGYARIEILRWKVLPLMRAWEGRVDFMGKIVTEMVFTGT